jgi:hypothetical protein
MSLRLGGTIAATHGKRRRNLHLAPRLRFCHSERSLRSEDLGVIARLLRDESLFDFCCEKVDLTGTSSVPSFLISDPC